MDIGEVLKEDSKFWGVWKVDDSWLRRGYPYVEEREGRGAQLLPPPQYLKFGFQKLPYKAVVRVEESGWRTVKAVVSTQYELLPNEAALDVAEKVAERVGAERIAAYFEGNRLYALYRVPFESEVGEDRVRLGFYIVNSIDGTLAFGASLLNEVARGPVSFPLLLSYAWASRVLSPRHAAAVLWQVHRKGRIDVALDRLAGKVGELVERGKEALAMWEVWREVRLEEEVAKELAGRVPEIYLPPSLRAVRRGVTLAEVLSVWDALVEVAKKIWFSRTASVARKRELYRQLLSLLSSAVEEATEKR